MADDKVRKLVEDALNLLAAELEAGKSEALKNYQATHVAGCHTWRDLGRHVKTGEKASGSLPRSSLNSGRMRSLKTRSRRSRKKTIFSV